MRGTAVAISRPSGPRAVLLGLFVIVTVGGVLRFAGIWFGAPYVYHPDEWVVARSAIDMARTGDWNPHQFYYASLLHDVEAIAVAIRHALGGATLATHQPWLYSSEVLPEQFEYILLGRAIVALMATATIVVVFETARRLAGAAAGLVAAAILAVMPLHVVHSVSLTTDAPLALMCALTLAVTFKASTLQSDRWWLLTGILAGLACSTKWNGIAVIGVPLLAWAVTSVRPDGPGGIGNLARSRTPWLILVGGALGLVVATPAVILDAGAVADAVQLQATVYATGSVGDGMGSLEFYARTLGRSAGLLLALCLAGLALMAATAVRDPNRRAWVIVPAFVIAWFAITSLPPLHYQRNLVPILPYLAVAGGVAVAAVGAWLQRVAHSHTGRTGHRASSAVVATLVGAILLLATAASVSAVRSGRRPDTRQVAQAWMLQNLPRGTFIAREISTPQTSPDQFKVHLSHFLWHKDLDWYRDAGVRYLIASSTPYSRFVGRDGQTEQDAFYRELFALPEVFRIDRGNDRPGPTIRIFRLDPD